MRRVGLALLASVALAGCVQTRQYADVEFTPPQGNYKLLVMRPDVSVGSVTTGGMVEPRADWTETGPGQAARRASGPSRPARGGNVFIMEKRNSLPGVDPETVAELERLHYAVGSSIALHKYSGALPADQARQGSRLDAGRGCRRARAAAPATTMRCSFMPRTASPRPAGSRCRCSASPAASSASAHRTSAAAASSAMPAWSICRTGEVVWFNVVQASSQIAGIKMGDIRTDEGAAQMVDRLLDRMKPGRNVRAAGAQPMSARSDPASSAWRGSGARRRHSPPASPKPAFCPRTWFR